MKTIKELKEYLLENFVDEDGDLRLGDLDLSEFDGNVWADHWKVKRSLSQSNNKVGGYLYQGYNEVKGSLRHSWNKVEGDLYQANNKVEGSLDQSGNEVKGKSVNEVKGKTLHRFW